MTERLFERMPRSRLYEHIVSSIEDLIISGKLKPGDRLPPERELALTMEVGRGAVRESVKLLADRGLVQVLPGRGTFVSEPQGSTLTATIDRFLRAGKGTHGDLTEVRRVLEVAIAGLAAERASEEDVQELRDTLAEMEASIGSPDDYVAAHLEFHSCLARATGNTVFPLLINAMVDLLRDRTFVALREPAAVDNRQFWHRRLVEAVANHDSAAARDAMERHLTLASADGEAKH